MTIEASKLFGAIRKSPNLASGLVESFVAQIESGELRPGQRLPTEQALVAATGVSRTVVREALAALRTRGLVTTRQGLGAFVSADPAPAAFAVASEDLESISDVLRLLELRMSVEIGAAGLSAQRRTEGDLARMHAHLDRLEDAITSASSGAQEDFAFHRAVLQSTQNPYFVRFLDAFGSSIIPRQRLRLDAMTAQERQAYLRRIQREHRKILEAIAAGDAAAAQRAARDHLLKAYQRYEALGQQGDAHAPA
ncbi:FadR/GntR family transcriptional regulator [Labrys wisconsinensis]|uniref:DNA-binding FadR family transcriptional regulator n=1 Tax=Labrys wisconsinensis TaxID=425677 RepID=A0ABU0J8C0_9HYPH|nr:FadR/GntR family transcriptional regulator [Labrys wisconsinensis]MDQ0469427.1 DNA-binding FadR family transcriptional regulator [Labrys wisconsinensis]